MHEPALSNSVFTGSDSLHAHQCSLADNR